MLGGRRIAKEFMLLLFSLSVVSNSLRPHGLHTRLLCPSPSPGVFSDSCPLSWWCHLTILSSVAPFSSCLLSFPSPGSFPMSWLLASGGQGIEASASVLPMNIQERTPVNQHQRVAATAGLSFLLQFSPRVVAFFCNFQIKLSSPSSM